MNFSQYIPRTRPDSAAASASAACVLPKDKYDSDVEVDDAVGVDHLQRVLERLQARRPADAGHQHVHAPV